MPWLREICYNLAMILKHRDRELLRFEWLEPQGVRVLSVVEENRRFLPLEMKGRTDDEALWMWLRKRVVPKGRAYIQSCLDNLGLRGDDVRGIITFCLGLSLNDVHWVDAETSGRTWAQVNLYANPFSETLAFMAFTGADERVELGSTSPELTTNGMLAKCWRRIKGDVLLYKSGTEGAANCGFEPYSEFYAAQLADALGLNHVDYGLAKFKGRLCSTCSLFTSNDVGFIPAGRLLSQQDALADERFSDIFFFDALICNPDRHLGNFGYLVAHETNEIVGVAPIFDNGYGLFSLALYKNKYRDEFADLGRFAAARTPALYRSWMAYPGGLTLRQRGLLEKLVGFRFTRHENYNLPTERLRLLEDFLQKRIRMMLDYGDKADDYLDLSRQRVAVKGKNGTGDVAVQVLENMRADPFVSTRELSELLGVTARTVQRILAKLRQEGRITRVGSDKTGHWVVAE